MKLQLPTRTPRVAQGFTLIEMMVVIAISVLLLMIAVPAVQRAIQNSRTSSLVHRLPQDMAWVRNQAATTQIPHRIVLGPGCQWQTERGTHVAGTPPTVTWDATSTEAKTHSLTAATASADHPGVTCALSVAAPHTIKFDGQGLIEGNVSPTLTVESSNGQQWTLRVLLSGLTLLNAATSS